MRYLMIRGYSDHAANERTFLAWVRTGIAVIAFGFVIEKFNLFVLTMANANSLDAGRRLQLERLSGALGRYDGLRLILLVIPARPVPRGARSSAGRYPAALPRRPTAEGVSPSTRGANQ